MNNKISFLLGSGFSVADGLPLVSQINKQILKITENEIYVHSDMNAYLVKAGTKTGSHINKIDEIFFVDFIKFYSTNIISNPIDFDYEVFFDYLTAYSTFDNHKDEIHEFCEEFRKNNAGFRDYIDDDANLIFRFTIFFTKIISSFLQSNKYYEDVSLGNYPPYDEFASFLRLLLKDKQVKVHSLNHDLLFEHIASKLTDLWQHYTDGFDDLNSPYYGEVFTREGINKNYKVRLKRFIENFNKSLCHYKLHGSVDCYIADITSGNEERIKKDYGVTRVFKEVYDSNTLEYSYSGIFQRNYPDFLSGSTSKIILYDTAYYRNLLEHFKNNLENSDLLYVIGYGFKDDGINNILISHYLGKGKKMVVIDRTKPKSNLLSNFKVEVIEKPFEKVMFTEYMAALTK